MIEFNGIYRGTVVYNLDLDPNPNISNRNWTRLWKM